LAGSRPLWPLVFFGLAVVSLVLPVVGMVAYPSILMSLVLLPLGTGLAFLLLYIYYNMYYLSERSKPSFLERIRVWKCPYCGERRGRMVDRVPIGEETRAPGQESAEVPRHFDLKGLAYKEGFLCSNCGNTWSKTIVHEMRAYPVSHPDDSVPEQKEAESPRDSPWD
jgi:predicted RNA-binding Zn-ribbon protein involved in translation (DUF1610 family)